jgi:predicted TIM-barrel fold metal-dependent hydrolase
LLSGFGDGVELQSWTGIVAFGHVRSLTAAPLSRQDASPHGRLPGDERRLWPLFQKLEQIGLPVVFDTGSGHDGDDGEDLGEPALFEDMLKDFPRLRVIMAHLASAYSDQRIYLAERYSDL